MRLPALSAVILAITAGSALAQKTPPTQPQPPANAAPATAQAPIGHRQPTKKDLPPATVQEEKSDKPSLGSAASDFGPLRSICRGC
jgi:hypothetical protein